MTNTEKLFLLETEIFHIFILNPDNRAVKFSLDRPVYHIKENPVCFWYLARYLLQVISFCSCNPEKTGIQHTDNYCSSKNKKTRVLSNLLIFLENIGMIEVLELASKTNY